MSKPALPPPTLQQIAKQFYWSGWIGFWTQLVLGVIAGLVLIFSSFSRTVGTDANNPGTGIGILFAVLGLGTLVGGLYWSFRYTRISKQLQGPSRPSKSATLKTLEIGIAINLAGMLLTILGAEAIVGSLLARSLSQPQALAVYDTTKVIRSLDIFVVQANTNTIAAHFCGIVASLWLFNRVSRQ